MPQVHITIDTECSIGGALRDPKLRPVGPERAILGEIGKRCYGVPLIMDILEEHGLRGTFFLEVLASRVVDREGLAQAYNEIVRRGHDVQLHVHPAYRCYRLVQEGALDRNRLDGTADLIGKYPAEEQLEILREGCELFQRLVGRKAVAFRAGCFGASDSTLQALEQLGIVYDSSFNATYCGNVCLMEPREEANTPWQSGGVWELPVTNFETGIWKRGLKPLDVAAVSLMEMVRVLQQADRLQMKTIVIIMHSFTLVKIGDVQFRRLRPDTLVIRRFRGLCRFLATHRENFPVATFSELATLSPFPASASLPRMGALLPLCRKVVQGINRVPWV